MSGWTCWRCASPRRRLGRSDLCVTCWRLIREDGQGWCARCKQVRPTAEMTPQGRWCRPCSAADKRRRCDRGAPGPGYVTVAEAARRLHYTHDTLVHRCINGSIQGAVQRGRRRWWWIPEETVATLAGQLRGDLHVHHP